MPELTPKVRVTSSAIWDAESPATGLPGSGSGELRVNRFEQTPPALLIYHQVGSDFPLAKCLSKSRRIRVICSMGAR